MPESDRRSGKGCWYFTYVEECPLCSRGDMTRERRYGARPEDPCDRYEYTFSACGDHFA